MVTLLLKYAKRVLTLLIVAFLLTTTVVTAKTNEYINYKIETQVEQSVETVFITQRQTQVVVHPGEFNLKQGKRIYVNNGVNWKDIATDIPIHKDNEGYFISEYDINLKVAKKVYKELKRRGVDVKLQITENRSGDLNQVGRTANKDNPYLFLSLHHNYYNETSEGYFTMYNKGNEMAKNIANRLSSSIENNGMVKRREPVLNTGQIGELNTLNNSVIGCLMELGFFSNKKELIKICSDKYTDYVAEHLADEIVNILNDYWK